MQAPVPARVVGRQAARGTRVGGRRTRCPRGLGGPRSRSPARAGGPSGGRRGLREISGQFETGLPKSRAGVRVVAIPLAIVPDLAGHLTEWSEAGTNGRLFVGPRGATPKRSNFNRYWQQALSGAGIAVDPDVGLHLHDLRHVGNDLRSPGASIRDLMAHMGHSTHNAALVYQHADVQRQQAMAAKLSDTIEEAIWPTSGPATSNVNGKAKRPARPQRL